ncbi:hypothetical protein DU504_06255 [Haloplanus salinus]|uniref:Uncharacterized protein n=1 Tax=Haloplanus salinus TaxID=1126245 RepID=A0A368N8S3_9EURY|nr:hypothetical protein DU504_06255 [Haloplanus salinus]
MVVDETASTAFFLSHPFAPGPGWSDRTMRGEACRAFLRSAAAVAGVAAVPTAGAAGRAWPRAEAPVDVCRGDTEG